MKDFNIAKYLKENHLGPHAILGAYVDLHALKEDMDAVNALTDKWKNDPSTDPEGDWRNKPFDQARASAEDWFDEYEEEGRLDDFYGMSVEELIDALELFGEPDAKKVAPILHKMINSEADVEESLDKEEMELDTKIPYEGPERKVDGFGDKYKQTNAVEEADGPPFGMPDKSEDNPWMDEVDGTDAYKFGNWTCYYDYPGVLAWSYKDVPLSKLAVYATPDWESDGTTPIQIDIDEETQDKMTLKQSEFADFNEYATAMKPYLDRIEDLESDFGSLAPSNDSMDTDDSVNPFPSIMKEKEDNSPKISGGAFDYEEDDRFASLGGDQIKSAIKSLMDSGFDSREIAQFVVDTIRAFKSFKEEVTVSSSGVQMEGEEFKWTARDQQGKLHGILYVKPMGDTLMVTADDGMPGTKYTKADIADAMGRGEFIRFRGKDLALDTRMKAWANS